MLTPKQRQYLKAQAHHLKPLLQVGKTGVSEGLLQEIDQVLASHELMKIKLNQNTFEDLESVVEVLIRRVEGLHHVWTIGHTLLVFRPAQDRPTRYPLPK